MSRSLVLILALLATISASAALPIAPSEPRIAPMPHSQLDPAAVTNGRTTLVAWAHANSPYPQTHDVYARLLGVHRHAVLIGPGVRPQVAWNGRYYLIANSISGSRFNTTHPFPNVAVTQMSAVGTIGARRTINTSVHATVTGVAWNLTHWAVAYVTESGGHVALLDPELNVTRTIDLGAAHSVGLTTIQAAVWVVHQRTNDTEVFPLHDETTRFRLAGRARMTGRVAIVEELLRVSILDPRNGFPEPKPILATSDVPLVLLHAAPFDTGALFVIHSPLMRTLLLVVVDGNGNPQEYTAALTDYPHLPGAAVGGSTLFVQAPWNGPEHQIFALPLVPWPRTPFTLTADAIVSVGDTTVQYNPILVSVHGHSVAFWNETIDGQPTLVTRLRSIGPDGVPFGPVAQLPFEIGLGADAVFENHTTAMLLVFVWVTPSGDIEASTGGPAVRLGIGSAPAVARAGGVTFVVWRNSEGTIVGTPLFNDATPVVPGGLAISQGVVQGEPEIVAVANGFRVLWPGQSVIVSPAGTLLTSSSLGTTQGNVIAGGQLVAWSGTLLAPDGERVTPPWGDGWTPVAIHPHDNGRHLVAFVRDGVTYTSIVTIAGGKITSAGPPRFLIAQPVAGNAIAVVDGEPFVVFTKEQRVWVATQPGKRRAVR
jgi:hypothetical protein